MSAGSHLSAVAAREMGGPSGHSGAKPPTLHRRGSCGPSVLLCVAERRRGRANQLRYVSGAWRARRAACDVRCAPPEIKHKLTQTACLQSAAQRDQAEEMRLAAANKMSLRRSECNVVTTHLPGVGAAGLVRHTRARCVEPALRSVSNRLPAARHRNVHRSSGAWRAASCFRCTAARSASSRLPTRETRETLSRT